MFMGTKYIRLTKSFYDKGTLIKPEDLYNHVNDDDSFYASTYFYNEDHYKQFQQTGSVKGFKGVLSDSIWLDFDNDANPELAQQDAIESVNRLLKHQNVKESDIEIYFSGNRGFHVILRTNTDRTPDQIASLVINNFGKDLKTLDFSMYDTSQILRVPGTRHQDTKLFKIPLTFDQLKSLSIKEIKMLAQSLSNIKEDFDWTNSDVELKVEVPKEIIKKVIETDVDWNAKPNNWKNCKWSLLQGEIKPGNRHEALLVIAATCRGLNYTKDMAYDLCKGALRRSVDKYGQGSTTKEELYNNIIEDSVYNDFWQGGQYTCKTPGWLQSYCDGLGIHKCDRNEKEEASTIQIDEAFEMFKDYAKNIDKLTVKTGIDAIDRKLRMTIGMSVGIVAPPAVGKTSISIQILNNMSKQGHQSIFFSYDMYHAMILQKLIQKHKKLSSNDIFDSFNGTDSKFEDEVKEMLRTEYSNVEFCFDAGQNVEQIRQTIKNVQEKTGKKPRLIVVDYNELVMSDYSDPTQSSAFVAQKLREIAITEQVCVISLFQPSKISGSPADELKSYRSIKGSSAIEQAASVIIGMWRPGFDPRKPEEDRYLTVACLKNRMGPIFSIDLNWDGLTGSVRELSEFEVQELQKIKDRKKSEKEDSSWN